MERLKKRSEKKGGLPKLAKFTVVFFWEKKLSPFGLARFFGEPQSIKSIKSYVVAK